MKLFFARMRAAARIARPSSSVSQHDFISAGNGSVSEQDLSRTEAATNYRHELKGTGFNPYICSTKNPWALAPEGRRRVPIALLTAILAAGPFPAFGQAHSAPPPNSNNQVIYSRSTDQNGQTTTTTGPAASLPAPAAAPIATDAEREAVTYTDFNLDVHLRPADQYIAVRAIVTVRNDGKAPLAHIPLQISSSLNWERIRTEGQDVKFQVATLNSDADHTGQLHEAAVPLARPLAPGQTLQLDATYSGTIAPNAQRLLAIGTPDDIALHSDWDVISPEFTGLRGFGDVVWYPVSSVPVILGDGARLFDEMGEHKLRLAGAHFRLQLAEEFPDGEAPTIALINGHPAALTVTGGTGDVPGVATAALQSSTLGFDAPSLFVAVREARQATNTTLWTLPADQAAISAWSDATGAVTLFLQGWLGKSPRSQLTILDLPDPEDAPFESGALLATSIRPAAPDVLEGILAHALTHAWMRTATQAPPAWLDEGLAHFMGTLWVEKESGRARALELMEAQRQALALAEPASPGTSPGQPLAQAISPIYYRTKATYVLWMLRDLAGDDALSAALRAYNPAADASKGYGRDQGIGNFEKLVEQSTISHNLGWFFADWVDADKGLPDLSIAKVYTEPAKAGNTLVAVTISNVGYASAEVPVTVSTTGTSVTDRVLVPARGQIVQRILILGTPTQVQVNDGTVPEVEASEHLTTIGNQTDSPSSSPQGVPQ